MDVGEDTARGDGHAAEQLVELLVVLDGQGDVAGHDAGLLVVAGGVAGELEDLGAEVLEDRGEVDGGAGAHAGGVLALAEVAADTGDGELKSGLGRGAGALLLAAASLSFSGHGCRCGGDEMMVASSAIEFYETREGGFVAFSARCVNRLPASLDGGWWPLSDDRLS
ncbi:hypothetical protein ACHAWF_001681 [Thalassiosira exigua]